MKPRQSVTRLARGLNLSGVIAWGWWMIAVAAEPVAPVGESQGSTSAPDTNGGTQAAARPMTPPGSPAGPEVSPSPTGDSTVEGQAPAILPLTPEAPSADGDASDELIPQIIEGSAPLILPPDGVTTSSLTPLSEISEDLASATAAPSTLPVGGSLGDPSFAEADDAGDVEPAAVTSGDDRSAPWIAATGGYSMPTTGGFGGGFGGGLPAAPSGFTTATPDFSMGGGGSMGGVIDGLRIDTTLTGLYTSNVNNSPGEPFSPILDDFIFGLGGAVGYLSKANDWTFGGSYNGRYNFYLDQSDYSGYNQGLGLVGNYDGGVLTASLTAGIQYEQGVNRYYSSGFVQQTNVNANLNLRYRLSNKTTLQGDIGQSFSTTSENSYNDTESFNLGLAALWRYSKLTEFGPGVRYTFLSGGNRDSRTSIGPELLVNYQLATKISLNSRVGVEFSQYDSGGSADPSLSGSIGLNYNASKLWGLNLSLYRGTSADASSADVFTEIGSVRLGYVHKIRRVTLNLGLGYEINSYETSDDSSAFVPPDRNYFKVDSSLGMAVFSNTCFASVFIRYDDQSSDSASETWDAIQSGFSISRRF